MWTGKFYLFIKVIKLWQEIKMKQGEENKKKKVLKMKGTIFYALRSVQ